ncbi:MAG: metallophosphoesterase family protein [Anaerolineae bacterium]|nr:metallophosphoesterase family protein [Anaerolineae bacterium]
MKVGVIADTHNHIENTRRALNILKARGVERIIHCGDITTPKVIDLFAGTQATFVFGNMDQGHAELMESAKHLMGVGSMGYLYTADWDGVRLAVCHGNDGEKLEELIQCGLYRYVFHGHTHRRRDERIGTTRVVNPGAVGGKRHEPRSICVVDFATDQLSFIEIPED